MKVGYYAIFNYDEYDIHEEKYGIAIEFPDIPECISCARSEKEGFLMAKEVLEFITTDMKVHELPKVSELSEITLQDNEKAFYISYNTEDVDLSNYTYYDV